jgi:hypothetical protein
MLTTNASIQTLRNLVEIDEHDLNRIVNNLRTHNDKIQLLDYLYQLDLPSDEISKFTVNQKGIISKETALTYTNDREGLDFLFK